MKISGLLRTLKVIKKVNGDLEVFLSADSEGNHYGTVEKGSFGFGGEWKGLVIFPHDEYIDEGRVWEKLEEEDNAEKKEEEEKTI